jgi:competence protein CoiA
VRFAMVDDRRIEATPGQTGHCPNCAKPMIAKCGTQVIWHWAHKGVRCDGWWEPETAWHRAWKDQFPAEWQEFVCEGDGGERHIADVFTSHGLVIEFQHSRLPPEEQAAREAFYRNMVWVVDGTRLASDVARFMDIKDSFHRTHLHGILMSNYPRAFPAGWTWSSMLVVFDFAGAEGAADSDLWCQFPGYLQDGRRLVAPLPRDEFVRMAREQSFIYEVQGIMAAMAERYRQEEALWFGRPPHTTRYGRRR